MKKRFLALALGTLAFGVTLGGVKMGLGHQDAMMVKAEYETLLTSLTFSAETNSKSIGGYTNSWTGTASDGTVFNITNFNNNNNNWKYVKCGSKKGTSVASIETKETIAKPIGRIALKIGAITKDTTKINSIKLEVRNAENQLIETINLADKTADTHYFLIKTPAENLKYKFVFDCQQGSNGMIQVDQIDFYSTDAAGGEPEPVAPVARITATANAGSEFYAGTKVSLSDFTFVGFDADGKETTLAGDITIENPLLVEGKNIIKFIYQSGETSVNFECEVNAIKTTLYTKTINVKDIAVGKRILIAGKNGEAVLGAETVINSKSVRALVAGAPNNGTLLPTEGFVPLVVLPAKNGSFALYDETAKGVLCATSSGDNVMGTQTDFASIDANSFATIAAGEKDGDFVIKFSGNFTKNILSCNTSQPRFSCYSSAQSPTSIFVSNDEPFSFNADAWADSFIANVSSKCDASGATATWTADWNKAKEVFEGFGIPDKMAVLYGTGSEKVNQAIATYKFIVDKYNIDDYLGLGTGKTNKANALMLPGATDSTTWTLVGIGAVTIAASASLLFFRRKKSN